MCIRKNETILPPPDVRMNCASFLIAQGRKLDGAERKFTNQSMHSTHTTTHNTNAIHQTSGSQDLEEIRYSDSRPRESRGAAPACVDRSLLAACPRGRTDRCFAGSKPLFPRGIACLSVEPRSMKKWGSGLISAIKPACEQAHHAIPW